jgi:BMFP domain-containing protein YqiC
MTMQNNPASARAAHAAPSHTASAASARAATSRAAASPTASTRAESRSLSRRSFLQAAGVMLALPFLDAMLPSVARAALAATPFDAAVKPRRMLAICNNLGLLPDHFFPRGQGRDYSPSPYLKLLANHRDQFTVFSGVSHPDVDGGHPADNCFLTAAPHPGRGGFRNTISLDQFIAERIGHLTRFPSMNLGVNVQQGARSLSWTGSGVLIPAEEKASNIYKMMFLQGSRQEVEKQQRQLEVGKSILDSVADQAKDLQRGVGSRDRDRLDQYFTSVRELEKRMAMSREWDSKPKPKTTAPMPLDPASPREYMEKVRLMYDMAKLAFETDSTRSVALLLDSVNSPAIEVEGIKITSGYHDLSHHGRSPVKLAQLQAIDEWHMKLLDNLFTELKEIREDGQTLLDRTMILYGTNLGNANTHVTTNLPTLFAGGGFRHGQHLVFDNIRNYPLPNLFVSMLQRMGIEVDKFASATGTMRGLEMA